MAIIWEDGKTTHVGLVIGNPYTRTDRVMSDIYADQGYIYVYDPDKRTTHTVKVWSSFELCSSRGDWSADIETGEYAEDYKLYLEECEERARERAKEQEIYNEQQRQLGAKKRLLAPCKGRKAKVVKGRKVPKGTEGTIIWVGDNGYGESVGIKDAKGVVQFTAVTNVIVTAYGLDFGEDVEDWVALENQIRQAQQDAREKSVLPEKRDTVREKKNPSNRGNVFWVKGTRLGFKKGRNNPPTWADMHEVEKLNPNTNNWESYHMVEPVLPGDDPQKAQDPVPSVQKEIEGITNLPEPFCHIRQISMTNDGKWAAYDEKGGLITLLPEETAKDLSNRLA